MIAINMAVIANTHTGNQVRATHRLIVSIPMINVAKLLKLYCFCRKIVGNRKKAITMLEAKICPANRLIPNWLAKAAGNSDNATPLPSVIVLTIQGYDYMFFPKKGEIERRKTI